MKTLSRHFLVVTFTLILTSLFGQGVFYTVSGEVDEQRVSIDSILFENLHNDTRLLFENLSEQKDYVINLNAQTLWGATSIDDLNFETGFSLLSNTAGSLSIACNYTSIEQIIISIYNVQGQNLYSTPSLQITAGNTIHINLAKYGIYLVKIESTKGAKTFKALGSNIINDFSVDLNYQKPSKLTSLKSNYDIYDSDFDFDIGDSLRISVYKNGYYARPITDLVDVSKSINFIFEVSTVTTSGISDAYVVLDENTTTVTVYNDSTGRVQITFSGVIPEINAGDIITVDVDTIGYLRKVISTTISDGSVTFETEQAYLNDVFVDTEFKLHTEFIEPNNALESTSSMQEIITALTDEQGYIHPLEVIYFDETGVITTKNALEHNSNIDEPLNILDYYEDLSGTDLYGTEGDNIRLFVDEGYTSFVADAVFEFDFDDEGRIDEITKVKLGDIKNFQFYLDAQTGFKSKLVLDMSAAYSMEDTKHISHFNSATAKFIVPPGIPIWITFNSDIFGSYAFIADDSLHADWGFESNHSLQIGGLYESSTDSFNPIYDNVPDNIVYPLKIEGDGNASARFEIFPRVDIKFYSILGTYTEIAPFVDVSYEAAFQSQITNSGTESFLAWNSNLDLGLDSRLGMDLTFLGLHDKEFEPIVINAFTDSFWRSPERLELLTELPTEADAGTMLNLKFKVTDLLDLPVALCPVYIEGDGSYNKQLLISDINGEVDVEWTSDDEGENSFTSTIYNAEKTIVDQVSASVTINSSATVPTVVTYGAAGITETSAAVGGNVTSDGGATVTENGIYWGTSPNPETTGIKRSIGSGTGIFATSLTSLIRETTYYLKAYAINGFGEAIGNEASFTTNLANLTVTTSAVTVISETSATVGGNVINDDDSPVTENGIYWSTSQNSETTGEKLSIGSGAGSFTTILTGLASGTTYYIKAYAINANEISYGNEISFNTGPTSGETGSFNDTRDGQTYITIEIGEQVWMAENLKYLPTVVGSATGSESIPYYYVYDYNGTDVDIAKLTANYTTYGVLYNWTAAVTSCPSGWRLPSDSEWTQLTNYLINNGYGYSGSGVDIGKSMASVSNWHSSSEPGDVGNDQSTNNSSGFTALPGALRDRIGSFSNLGIYGYWWSSSETSSEYSSSYAFWRLMHYGFDGVPRGTYNKEGGFSVRCLKNSYLIPTVITNNASLITETSATVGGNVTSDGGATVTENGIYWGASQNPETTGAKISIGDGTGTFGTSLTGLTASTTYYVNAYAINNQGEALGDEISFTTNSDSDTTSTFTDSRDGQTYTTIEIGNQVWMAENLKYLPVVVGPRTESYTDPYYYVYGYYGTDLVEAKATANYTTYGVLYNWPAACASCPSGWHLPSDSEWTELSEYLINNGYGYDGSGSDIGKSMAATSGWNTISYSGDIGNDQATNNSSGFTALPGGDRYNSGAFDGLGNLGFWWSSSENSSSRAWYRNLRYFGDDVRRYDYYNEGGFSVRCLKD